MKSFITAAFIAASASLVSAHGTVSGFWAGGQDATGAVRAINSVNPVVDVNSPEMACGWGSAPAGSVAEVSAGSEVEWQLKNGDGGGWIHAKGPVTYAIYKCPGSAKDCQPTGAGWAMIGHNGNDGSGDWQMAKFTRGENVKVKIPAGTPTGDYLIRQELIALHNGHEQYIQCAQIHVKGTREGNLDGAQLVSFPGAYSGSEPGFSYNVYGTSSADYPWPGPALWNAEGGDSAPPQDQAPPPPPTTQTPPAPKPTQAPPPPPSGGSCVGGAIQCNGESAWSMCANGAWVNMGAVAPGTKCSGGAFIKRSSSRLFKNVA